MLTISSVAKREKNKLSTGSAFIILVDICLGNNETDWPRICYNTEDVEWRGKLYQAFPFTLGEVTETTDGSEPNVELKVDNTTQALESYIEASNGGNGTQVVIRVVNTLALDNDTPEVEEYFTVTKCTVDQSYVTFSLGAEYSSRTRRPLNRYMKNNCPFRYKGIRCGATSKETSCDHTLKDCRLRNNSVRFGGYQGIDQKGVYVNE